MYLVDLADNPPKLSPIPPLSYHVNNVYVMKTKVDLAIYYHRALFSPPPATLINAINQGFFSTWPGLTADLISRHLPKSTATDQGHMKLVRQNLRSTQQPTNLDPPVSRSKTLITTILTEKDLLATDLTGRFPVMSSRGHKSPYVAYHLDANYIAARPIRNRSEHEHCRVYKEVFDFFSEKGLRPEHYRMDNECPLALKKIIKDTNKNSLQLVPPP
jgi:hypothetical protein